MGECIGLDFGTTYTTVSKIDNEELININFGSRKHPIYDVPSIVAVNKSDNKDVNIGKSAISKMLSRNYSIYRGFKMLLNEDELITKGKGYSREYRPIDATEDFLTHLFEQVREKERINGQIEKVVVGVPYVWTIKNNDDLKGNDEKKRIIIEKVKLASGAHDVEFREEPALACSYFADKLKRIQGTPFKGHILVIDYGGGTLDVTLCKISYDNGKTKVDPKKSWGAGENTDGQIGNAGLRFMEKVADITLKKSGISKNAERKTNCRTEMEDWSKAYSAFVNDIEEAVIESEEIPKNITKKKYKDPKYDGYREEIPDVNANYKGNVLHVEYGTLVEAYEQSKQELEGVLAEAKEWIDNVYNKNFELNEGDIVNYEDSSKGSFKIATIGGFCNFMLTQDTITKDLDWLKNVGFKDKRYENMDEDDRAVAISQGAALLANDLVLIPHKFPYSLYVYGEKESPNATNRKSVNQVETVPDPSLKFRFFEEDEEYLPGKPVFLKAEKGDKRAPVLAGKIPFIERKRGEDTTTPVSPKRDIPLPRHEHDRVYLAIAMERNEELTLYIYNRIEFDKLSTEEKENPLNSALIGEPRQYPDIVTLLGNIC